MDRTRFVGRSAAAGGIGALCIVVGGIGVATAANGGSLLFGTSNAATHTTTLKDTNGTALSLITKKSKPPLQVSSKTLVKNLNSGELGGLSASELSTGSSAQFKINLDSAHAHVIELPQPTGTVPTETFFPASIVSTAKLAAGRYAVNVSTLAESTLCWLGTSSAMGKQQYSIASATGSTVSEAATFKVTKGQRVHEYCAGIDQTSGDPGGIILSAGINAVRVQTSLNGKVHPFTASVPLTRNSTRLLK
jgi:hypothetical protein